MIVPRNIFHIAGVCDPEAKSMRYRTDSVQFTGAGGRVVASATDGHIMLVAEAESDQAGAETVLVPQAFCELVTQLRQSPTDAVALTKGYITDSRYTIAIAENEVRALMKGRFPDCQSVLTLPKADSVNMRLDLRALKQMVDTLLAMAKGVTERVIVTLTLDRTDPERIMLSSSGNDQDSAGNVAGIMMGVSITERPLPTGPAWLPTADCRGGGG